MKPIGRPAGEVLRLSWVLESSMVPSALEPSAMLGTPTTTESYIVGEKNETAYVVGAVDLGRLIKEVLGCFCWGVDFRLYYVVV